MTDCPAGPIGAARRAADEREQRHADVSSAEQRAKQAEAELAENLGVIRALRRQRDEAEAALARVRAECDRIEAAVRANGPDPDLAGGYLACLRHVRAALDPVEDPAP
ncbi:hypothetical protein PL81_31135 [Streptomyces sp. RSD-27]|nr:hypothetical protein PL81_31135 [Streptomyces sp. RSD-27]